MCAFIVLLHTYLPVTFIRSTNPLRVLVNGHFTITPCFPSASAPKPVTLYISIPRLNASSKPCQPIIFPPTTCLRDMFYRPPAEDYNSNNTLRGPVDPNHKQIIGSITSSSPDRRR